MRPFGILKVIGVFLSTASLFGLLMFWSTNNPAAVGVPIALLMLSLFSSSKFKTYPWLLVIAIILVIILSYSVAGVPFLDLKDDIFARLLHFSELLLICVFILRAFIRNCKCMSGKDSKARIVGS